MSATFLEAEALVKAFKSSSIKDAGIVLEAIEIGNEADLYPNNGARPKNFTSTEYVKECVLISLSASRSIFTYIDTALPDGSNLLPTCLHLPCLSLHHSWARLLLRLHILPAAFRHKLSSIRRFFYLCLVL